MKKTIIDLPSMKRRIDLPADQWKLFQEWLEREEIQYDEVPPERAEIGTDENTNLVYRINGDEAKVLNYFR